MAFQRRDFLFGALTGAGAAAGVAYANRLAEEAILAEDTPPARDADPKPACPECPPAPQLGPDNVGPVPPDGRRLSFAQQGEDIILAQTFEALGIERPSFLDIGAFHPTIGSNTYLLYLAGSRGVLVEPNPTMVGFLRQARPGDTVADVGIGFDDATEADYYVVRDRPQLNTFSREQADRYVAAGGSIERVIKMPLRRINDILAEHFERTPDLVSIDVEGHDLHILQTMDLDRFRPAVFCVETVIYGTTAIVGGIVELLRGKGYAVRGGTLINTVFVDTTLLKAKNAAGALVAL